MNHKDIEIKIVDFDNAEEAINVQRKIFSEDGMINIIASLDRELFMKVTGLFYPDDNVKYYLAYKDKEAIGITGLYEYKDMPDEMWIAWFGVLPEHRRLGYGSKILEWTMKKALSQKKKTIRLYTEMGGNNEAIELYRKLGFIEEKYLAEKLTYNCYIFSKSLTAKPTKPFDNKNLCLTEQTAFENINEEFKEKIHGYYKDKYFK